MNIDLLVSALTHVILLPPVCLVLGIAAGMLLRRWKPRAGRMLAVASASILLVLSTVAGARMLMWPLLEHAPVLATGDTGGAGAIVVLAAGRIEHAPEYGGRDVPDLTTLARLRYGAHLQHLTGLPLLVTGGNASPDGVHEAKAQTMARVLRDDFRTPVAWVEAASETTAQNASRSARILKDNKVGRILLVTDALHMARAARVFAATGLEVVPAPTMFHGAGKLAALDFIPSAAGLHMSWYASYELAGLAWYRLRELTRPD
ncbi:YdcF family protein [Massilia cavernae]|uniref:YdcF family protein n=1 Tax=Massilia cavernae TaxID=2320864 RepID=A0A418XQ65_9BURK|nr:YdcF family protein [Massilia cavernae]RJG14556.1 YdcF family protein [Massilia cavernae]